MECWGNKKPDAQQKNGRHVVCRLEILKWVDLKAKSRIGWVEMKRIEIVVEAIQEIQRNCMREKVL